MNIIGIVGGIGKYRMREGSADFDFLLFCVLFVNNF